MIEVSIYLTGTIISRVNCLMRFLLFRLEKLYLEDLSLSTEFDPMLLKPLKNLDDLSLKNCRLSKIPFEMLDAVKDSLTSLDVSHNPLFTLSESDLRVIPIFIALRNCHTQNII